ncbi:energy transducer TonB [Hymenobacter sp. J193]|uniref:energy transducer TonB n=1 Tax=Hymenobacter sp. J193 TaxID=2898429 RepID=UPI00215179F1|nr:energy transducer TonB [Hymenobacter sp. J193]MCR5890063.1 energy transducer TonB [Hymenobacter sp. J193]
MLLLALGLAGALSGAPLPDSTQINRRTEYLDGKHQRVSSPVGAVFRVETILTDSIRGIEKQFYLPSGKLSSFRGFLNRKSHVWHGAHLEYYENGQIRLQESFVLGKVQGERVTFYPTGTLRRREQIISGQEASGECFGPDGKPVPYFPYMVMPTYPGGQDAFLNDIGRRIIYPIEAVRAHVEGIVLVKFQVAKDGKVENIKPAELPADATPEVRRVYTYLQAAAMQSVQKVKSFIPGQLDGEPIVVNMTVPVTFKIR